jgi:single-stranded DNA-binding protein
MEHMINFLHLTGKLETLPTVGHEAFGEVFYYLTISVPRLSGAEDLLPVTISERLLEDQALQPGMMLAIDGQIRSYNKVIDGAGRLLITAFAQRLVEVDAQRNPNMLQLTGTLCKPPAYRTTPFGREIADLMLAVNRAYGKSDYIPCITWGRSARFASRLHVGNRVRLTGRLQSRTYQKQLPDGGVVEKVAYEVSVSQVELAPAENLEGDRAPLPGDGAQDQG